MRYRRTQVLLLCGCGSSQAFIPSSPSIRQIHAGSLSRSISPKYATGPSSYDTAVEILNSAKQALQSQLDNVNIKLPTDFSGTSIPSFEGVEKQAAELLKSLAALGSSNTPTGSTQYSYSSIQNVIPASITDAIGQAGDTISKYMDSLGLSLPDNLPVSEEQIQGAAVAFGTVAAATLVSAVLKGLSGGGSASDELPTVFILPDIEKYYARRPLELAGRLASVSAQIAAFGFTLYMDKANGNWETKMPERAKRLRELLQKNGPAYIKLGQGVSVRPDILPEPYLIELQKLQDKVPPFSSEEAQQIMEAQLGTKIENVFTDRSNFAQPVAAASLGQVYKATLKESGDTVAVKVQRPGVLNAVTLDLYVTRLILLALAKVPAYKDSSLAFLAVIDNWGVRFLDELDYIKEAENGDRFRKEMGASTTLGEAIIVPKVYTDMVGRYMLVTEWIEGERVSSIDPEAPEGRERLSKIVATLLNAYLFQLLDSGFLHADPHPGNFLCTPEGRLCVLDYGLMTEVTESQRIALLEYVSCLMAKDYNATLQCLITLGFIPKEIGEDPEKIAIVAPLIGTVLDQLAGGGGAKSITVETVGEEITELGRQYPIVIPSYFGLIIRAFSALEGLGLQLDPKYSIVKECFPYLARRLLSDDSPPMHKMLRTFLYGSNGNILRVERVDELVSGYSKFTALAAEARGGLDFGDELLLKRAGVPSDGSDGFKEIVANRAMTMTSVRRPSHSKFQDPLSDPVARDALRLLFSRDGNYVQDLVVEELVNMADAFSREVNLDLIRGLRRLLANPLSPLTIVRALAELPLQPLLAPIQMTARAQAFAADRIVTRLELLSELSPNDRESLGTLRRLTEVFRDAALGNTADSPLLSSTLRAPPVIRFLPPPAFPGMPSPFQANTSPFELFSAARTLVSTIQTTIQDIGPGANAMAERFLVKLVTRVLDRLADGIERPKTVVVSPIVIQDSITVSS